MRKGLAAVVLALSSALGCVGVGDKKASEDKGLETSVVSKGYEIYGSVEYFRIPRKGECEFGLRTKQGVVQFSYSGKDFGVVYSMLREAGEKGERVGLRLEHRPESINYIDDVYDFIP